MKIYCSDCGTPHEYSGKKPNFCVNCGYSFAGSERPSKAESEEIEESEEIIEEIPEIDTLQVEIEPYQSNSIKLGEAVDYSNGSDGQPQKATRQKGKRMTKKANEEFLKDWQKEAGTSRDRSG